MERLYEEYKDIADFRLVYINEAHALDSNWAVPYAKELGIKNHTNYGERCEVAAKLLDDKSLTIPTVVDGMDNKVNKAYQAWPDRIYLVRKDGRLAVAAGRGPWGYKPAIKASAAWLKEYRATGNEPALPDDAVAADFGMPKASDMVGTWELTFDFGGQEMTGEMVVKEVDGSMGGSVSIESETEPAKLSGISVEGQVLRMKVSTPDGGEFQFEGTIGHGEFDGSWTGPDEVMTIDCSGKKKAI